MKHFGVIWAPFLITGELLRSFLCEVFRVHIIHCLPFIVIIIKEKIFRPVGQRHRQGDKSNSGKHEKCRMIFYLSSLEWIPSHCFSPQINLLYHSSLWKKQWEHFLSDATVSRLPPSIQPPTADFSRQLFCDLHLSAWSSGEFYQESAWSSVEPGTKCFTSNPGTFWKSFSFCHDTQM